MNQHQQQNSEQDELFVDPMTFPGSSNESYFRDCRYCGELIHMRQMRHGQWVAFDAPERAHKCGQTSEFSRTRYGSYSRGRSYNLYASRGTSSSGDTSWVQLIGCGGILLFVLLSVLGKGCS